MKTAKEILEETVTRYGLKVWEAHTDKMNRMIATEAMERYAEQFKISSSPVLADEGCDDNPYLLTGDELKRTADARKAGKH